jgi:hypothetical protein
MGAITSCKSPGSPPVGDELDPLPRVAVAEAAPFVPDGTLLLGGEEIGAGVETVFEGTLLLGGEEIGAGVEEVLEGTLLLGGDEIDAGVEKVLEGTLLLGGEEIGALGAGLAADAEEL